MGTFKIKSVSVKIEKYEKGEVKPFETDTHKIELSKEDKKDAIN